MTGCCYITSPYAKAIPQMQTSLCSVVALPCDCFVPEPRLGTTAGPLPYYRITCKSFSCAWEGSALTKTKSRHFPYHSRHFASLLIITGALGHQRGFWRRGGSYRWVTAKVDKKKNHRFDSSLIICKMICTIPAHEQSTDSPSAPGTGLSSKKSPQNQRVRVCDSQDLLWQNHCPTYSPKHIFPFLMYLQNSNSA